MTDLYQVLPNFSLVPFRHLTLSIERKGWTVAEIVTIDPAQLAKHTPIPLKEAKRYQKAIQDALKEELLSHSRPASYNDHGTSQHPSIGDRKLNWFSPPTISLPDKSLNDCLGGGFPVGHVSEIVGESSVGKTQFVLSLLLSAQLPAPRGLGRDVMYISTESVLVTRRLHEMLATQPDYQSLSEDERPSLDRIHFSTVNSFEYQDLMINYQLPEALKRMDIGLVVIDSIAANFRVEYQATTRDSLIKRAIELIRLGSTLKQLALKHDLAVVVTNQVSDRFDDVSAMQGRVRATQTSSTFISSAPTPQVAPSQASQMQRAHEAHRDELMSLDFQQCFFTGWGDQESVFQDNLKTPALGLTWANQLSARVVLKVERDDQNGIEKRKRYFRVVFAPFAPATINPVRYDIKAEGPVAVPDVRGEIPEGMTEEEYAEILDPKNWSDDENEDDQGSDDSFEDDEFP